MEVLVQMIKTKSITIITHLIKYDNLDIYYSIFIDIIQILKKNLNNEFA